MKTPQMHNGFLKLLINNYFISIFFVIILLLGLITVIKAVTAKDEQVYVKVKISQGYWWASTVKPAFWLASSFKKGDIEKSLSGKTIAEIQEVRYYPTLGVTTSTEQYYDVYITVKLLADYNDSTNKFSFKRSPVQIGTPIDFDFSGVQTSGTVINLSKEPLRDSYKESTVTIRKMFTNMWEYEGIQVGDSYFDGHEVVLEVIDKSYQDAYNTYNSAAIQTDSPINVQVVLKLKLLDQKTDLIYRETPIQLGRRVYLQSSNFVFDQYTVSAINK